MHPITTQALDQLLDDLAEARKIALLALGILLASCIALRATQANVIELMGGAM